MHPIIYDVAVSADGFIADTQGRAHMFPAEGAHVAAYMGRLAGYRIALMGTHTYTFGYQFGLTPGANPYPHMTSILVSRSLKLPAGAEVTRWRDGLEQRTRALKAGAEGPIYLCGGGHLAGQLLTAGLIDRLIVKRAPVLIGAGIPLFAGVAAPVALTRTEGTTYGNGVALECFDVGPVMPAPS
ncbi:dihydrofolate reductase family protein [Fluviibacterium sp. DFM31]|uniref:Dihydrofolate reductase family protein n=1 Tax=Meridianimarinicoccus marinus TaxID=3231483 RepID=A0ABV3L2E0_9RHOB